MVGPCVVSTPYQAGSRHVPPQVSSTTTKSNKLINRCCRSSVVLRTFYSCHPRRVQRQQFYGPADLVGAKSHVALYAIAT